MIDELRHVGVWQSSLQQRVVKCQKMEGFVKYSRVRRTERVLLFEMNWGLRESSKFYRGEREKEITSDTSEYLPFTQEALVISDRDAESNTQEVTITEVHKA